MWLIVAIVILFTGFPRAFAAVSTFLHVPLLFVLMGIVLRGSAFVFRAYGPDDLRHVRFWGRVFAIASTATPLFLGVIVGAMTEGRVPDNTRGSFAAVYISPWLTPFAVSVGLFALALFGYLAAVYLTLEAHDADERAAFRARALAAGAVVGLLAGSVLLLAGPDVRHGLIASPWAVPLHLATGSSAVAAFVFLARERYAWARIAAASQVTLILWGWALTQYPYVLRPHLTLAAAAAPANVQVMLLQVLGAGARDPRAVAALLVQDLRAARVSAATLTPPLKPECVARIEASMHPVRVQQELTNHIRVRAAVERRVANDLEAVLDAGRLVDVDVGGQLTRVGRSHEGHLQIRMRVAALEAAFGHQVSGQRLVQGLGRRLEERTPSKLFRQIGTDLREEAILAADEQPADVRDAVAGRVRMPGLRNDIQEARFP